LTTKFFVFEKISYWNMRKIISLFLLNILMTLSYGQESFPIKVDKKWGLINADGQIIVDPIYDAIGEFKQFGYAVMQRNGRVGMLQSDGTELIAPAYDDVKVLDSTLIAVKVMEDWKVINTTGQIVLEQDYDRIRVWPGGYLAYMQNGFWGMVDYTGRTICRPQFEGLRYLETGVFQTQINDRVGLMMSDGSIILEPIAEKVSVYSKQLFFFFNEGEWGAVNAQGRLVIPQRYQRYEEVANLFLQLEHSEGRDLFAFANEKLISESEYDAFYAFSEDYILCKKNRRLGLLDIEGNVILKAHFEEIQAFAEGQFRTRAENKWGIVSSGGSVIVPFDYDFIAPMNGNNSLVKIGNQFGLINRGGALVVPVDYDRIELEEAQAKAYQGDALTLYYFDEEGVPTEESKFKKHYTISIGKNKQTLIGPVSWRSRESDYSLGMFEWFYSSEADMWGLRKVSDGSIQIEPTFHTINVQKEFGFTIVGREKYSKGIFERTTFRYEMVYGIVNNEVGLLVSELNLLDVRLQDYEEGLKVGRVIFTNGKHGLMSRAPVGLMVLKDYAYIGEFHEGLARMSIKGKLSGSLKANKYGLGLLNQYLNSQFSPSMMLDYTLYDREFENEAKLTCEQCYWGYLDTLGQIMVQPQFSFARDFINDVGIVENEGKWGAVNRADKMVLPAIYDGVHFLENTGNKILRVYNNQQKYGLIDTLGQVTVNLQYDKIGAFNEGRLAVKRNGSWGFVNENGLEVIPCRFQRVKNFYGGLAAVKLSNKWGVIDKQGNTVIDFQYTRIGNFRDALTWVYTSKGAGYINAANEMIIEPKFNKAFDFQDGLARVVVDGKYGLVNLKGEYVVRPKYSYIEEFDENGLSIVRLGKSRIRYGLMDRSGRVITNKSYKEIQPFQEGLSAVKYKGEYGFVNVDGELVIPAIYSKVANFQEGRAAVQRNGLCGYIDKAGEEVVHLEFSKCLDFDKGKAVVYKGYRRGGLIDLNGNYIIEPSLNRLYHFSDGRGLVRDSSYRFYYITSQSNNVHSGMYQQAGAFQHGVAVVQSTENDQWGIINQKGIELITPKYDKIENFQDGYARVRIRQLSGLSNLNGELIVQPNYEYISYAGDGVFRVEQGDKIGYFDADGRWIWEIGE
jgi:hypothetical protein